MTTDDQPHRRALADTHLERGTRRSTSGDPGQAGTHAVHLLPEYHALVASGAKTVEVRTASPAKNLIRPGDRIDFHTDHDRPVSCEVTRVARYPDFAALLNAEDPAAINPDSDRHGILAALRGIYPSAKENLGALAIEIALLPADRPDW
ncbi:ASCH domain-containing protein [Kitasatospora purpeofusca]|uniref:ASCH domain-containing protein n=1 Tax=Kitasatospora purpeofusca TaxID=67352 RepID=UPI00380CF5C1